jgi:competence protein ComEA
MLPQRGLLLLIFLPLVFLSYDIGRHVLVNQDVPIFFSEERPVVQIALDGALEGSAVFQISDGFSLERVIKMADLGVDSFLHHSLAEIEPLQPGERIVLQVVNGEVADYTRGWMSSAQRIILGISLHPDRMTEKDWDYLPGVGISLAAEIEKNRQENGDFLELQALTRVRGIGPKRIKLWEDFFK